MPAERLADGKPIESGERVSGSASPGELCVAGGHRREREDRGAIIHQQLIGRIDAVPLDEREFRMVEWPALPVAERARELENAALASGEELLAGKFRRGAQIAPRALSAGSHDIGLEGMQMSFVPGGNGERRRLHLGKSMRRKMLPQGGRNPHAREQQRSPVGMVAQNSRHAYDLLAPTAARKSLANEARIGMVRPHISSAAAMAAAIGLRNTSRESHRQLAA